MIKCICLTCDADFDSESDESFCPSCEEARADRWFSEGVYGLAGSDSLREQREMNFLIDAGRIKR